MDDDDVPCSIGCRQPMADANDASSQHHTRCQPVDLLALQQEIQQSTDNMKAFFDSLFTSTGTIQRSNNKQSNDQQTTAAQMTEHMTTDTNHPHTVTCTLSKYLTQLKTPACFVPFCMLPQKPLRKLTNTHLLYHQPGQPVHVTAYECHNNQHQPMTLAHLALPNTRTAHDAPQPSLANVSPNQLDHPPDQPLPCRSTHLPSHYTVNL